MHKTGFEEQGETIARQENAWSPALFTPQSEGGFIETCFFVQKILEFCQKLKANIQFFT